MTSTIKLLLEKLGVIICPSCRGEGEIPYFCGHESTTSCYMCNGKGIVKSLKKQKNKKTCTICNGKGGRGCCNGRGFKEWESFELVD